MKTKIKVPFFYDGDAPGCRSCIITDDTHDESGMFLVTTDYYKEENKEVIPPEDATEIMQQYFEENQ
tara:strand:- start:504 stop:704 length:201 start_codon:yes stop_codon:yes gene_type:complete